MKDFSLTGMAKWLFGFLIFCFFYFLPKFLTGDVVSIAEPRVRLLLEQALSVSVVRWGLFVNVIGILATLLVFYSMLRCLAKAFFRVSRLSFFTSHALIFGSAWVFLIAINSLVFPLSDYSYGFSVLVHPWIALCSGLILLCALAWVCCVTPIPAWLKICSVVGVLGGVSGLAGGEVVAGKGGRNIIIIGVDSLSGAAFERARSDLPNLDWIVSQGEYHSRAYTLLGRTFPAWMSILSGREPVKHGGFFNLRALAHVDQQDLLTWDLKSLGYKTIFALDERRFNNMGEGFGFDRVIGPRVGALDFVLQSVNDTPLTNFILQISLAKSLLPFSYMNVASFANYSGDAFVDSTLSAVGGADKVFLAAHFESAHFPFKSRYAKLTRSSGGGFWEEHFETLKVVDNQVGRMMSGLKARGVLDDALVVLLSDHGEGLGLLETTVTQSGQSYGVQTFGHGVSLLSDHQSRIVLASVLFRNGEPVSAPSQHSEQVSLLDLRPFLTTYAHQGSAMLVPHSACFIVETDIRFAAIADYRAVNKDALMEQGAGYYEISDQGYLQLKESELQGLVASKDIGWRCRDRITYFSDVEKRFYSYALDERGVLGEELGVVWSDVQEIESYRREYQSRF